MTTHYTRLQPMTPDETAFCRQLGHRIAEHRKAQELTQAQLGELVGVTQQQIASFEIGRRRIPVPVLPLVAKALGTSVETLIDGDNKPAGKRGPTPKIQQQLEQLSQLPKAQQRLVSQLIDTVLAQASR